MFVAQLEKFYSATHHRIEECQVRTVLWIKQCRNNRCEIAIRYLGMQFGGVRSTSQVANSFIGTGRVAGAVIFVRSAIFGPGGPRDTRNVYVSPRLAAPVRRRLSMTVGVKIATRQRGSGTEHRPRCRRPWREALPILDSTVAPCLPVRNQSELSRWIAGIVEVRAVTSRRFDMR